MSIYIQVHANITGNENEDDFHDDSENRFMLNNKKYYNGKIRLDL